MSLSKTFRVVLISSAIEPAIDNAAMLQEVQFAGTKATRIKAYVSTRDERHLALIEGRAPSWYTLRPLSARELNALVGDLLPVHDLCEARLDHSLSYSFKIL